MRVLVLGAYGMLGSRICPQLEAAGHQVLRQGRGDGVEHQINPVSLNEVRGLVYATRPEIVVNLNALTDVDACEVAPAGAYTANCKTVEVVAQATKDSDVYLIHISTDQVYSGLGPHEEDFPLPCNVYGLTKYCGELHLSNRNACVLRTNFVGRSCSPSRRGFTDWIYSTLAVGDPITLFDDVQFSAMHMGVIGDVLLQLLGRQPTGVFNLGSRDGVSKAAFALAFAKLLELDTARATIGKLADKALKAARPLDMSMSVARLESALDLTLPSMEETIRAAANEYQKYGTTRASDGCF